MTDGSLFRAKAPGIMAALMRDFALTVADAAAILGNLGHESGGFRLMQEIRPLIPGSRGGYGWAQWTGARRRQFEQWCAAHALDPASDSANMSFLTHELRTSQAAAVTAVKRAPLGLGADALRAKVVAFELAFERAHPEHKGYDSRVRWANVARAALRDADIAEPGAPRSPDGDDPSTAALTAFEIAHAQRLLHDLRFYEVGRPDGRIGSRTIAAVAAFRHERCLAGPTVLDSALIAELERARDEGWRRSIDPARAEGEPDQSRIVASTERQATVTTATGGTIATGGLLVWLAQKFDAVQHTLAPLAPYARPFATLLLEYWWAFLGAALAYLLLEQARVRNARIEDHREGRTT
jgi:hypothetical protein